MSVHTPYQKHTWVTKEIIRREYLQNIEDGIYQEQQDAEAAETALENALEAEKQRARSSETTIQNNLTAEVTRATAAEEEITQGIQDDLDELSERISNEYTRATGVESSLQTATTQNTLDIAAEVSRATQAESHFISDTDYATTSNAGILKPDGTTVTVDANGVLSATGSSVSPQGIGFGYGTCVTAAATTAKVASLTGYNLVKNGYVSIKFSNAVPASATLDINSKGAKPIYYHGVAITANIIGAGDLATFVYDGTNYNLVGVDNVSSQIQTLTNQTEENTEDIATNLASINILKNNGNWRTGLRFKNLGTSFTSAQATALANGDFSEFWNGDYWVINGHNWRIVDNSGWARRRGDTNFDSNSLVVMPDDNLVLAEAYLIDGGTSGSNTDTHGYANCGYRTDEKSGKGRTQCKTLFQNAFGSSHVASHRELMSTSRGTGGALSWAWQDADVELPSEVNIYGHSVWGSGLESGVDEPSFNIGDRWGQFKLFELAPYMAINRGQNYWLRDIHSASAFAYVGNYGAADYSAPSRPNVGVRPYSIIK